MEEELEEVELQGGWRSLVSSIMFHAVRRFLLTPSYSSSSNSKESARQCVAATRWLGGGVGVITFEESCETLGYDPDAFLERLNRLKTRGEYNVPDLARRI